MSDDPFVARLLAIKAPPLEDIVAELCRASLAHELALRRIFFSLQAAGIEHVDPFVPVTGHEEQVEKPAEEPYTRLIENGRDVGPPPRHPLGY